VTLEQAREVMRKATTPVTKTKDGAFRYDEPPKAELIEAFKVLKKERQL
jgi:hypothetical protein